jgi:O-antigen/teichoic acid export membrane protein
MWKEGRRREEIEGLMSRIVILLTLMFVPLVVLVDLCGPELITILFGPKYLLDSGVMLLVTLSVFVSAVTMYAQKGLEVTGQTMVIAKLALAAALFSFVANLFAIHRFGVTGAAWVVILSQFIYIGAVSRFTAPILKISLSKGFIAKVFIWILAVEAIGRGVGLFSISPRAAELLPYLRVLLVAVATVVLFAISREIHSFGELVWQVVSSSSRKPKLREG